MIKNTGMVIVTFVLVFQLSSCGTQLNRAQSGAGIGAASGALIGQAIGHNTGSTLIGAAVGTMVGYIVGNEMDKYDNQKLTQVYEQGVSGYSTSWKNPDSGHMYHVTPRSVVQNNEAGICRTAEIRSIIEGRSETTNATACRDDYGSWVLQ